jgi:uncharacterized protein
MRAWRDRLAAVATVEAFDYPYAREGRRTPDRLPALVAAHRAAVAAALEKHGRHPPLVLAGKSMGGRVGCHLAVALAREAGEAARAASAGRADSGGTTSAGAPLVVPAALLCFGYPLVAARGGRRRDQVLLELATPILFVQGSRDPLCPLDDLATVRARMSAPSEILVVEGGDHSLGLRKRDTLATGRSQSEVDDAILSAVRGFLATTLGCGRAT